MGRRLFVGNLSYETTEDSLRAHFAADGRQVAGARVMLDRETGRSRGFGFIDLTSDDDVAAAIVEFDGSRLDGRVLHVSEANERPRTERPDRGERPSRPREDAAPSRPREARPRDESAPRAEARFVDDRGEDRGDRDRRERERGGRERGRERPRRPGVDDDDWSGRRGGKRGKRRDLDDDYDDDEW